MRSRAVASRQTEHARRAASGYRPDESRRKPAGYRFVRDRGAGAQGVGGIRDRLINVRDVRHHAPMHGVAEVYLRDVLASDLPVHFEHQSDPESARLSVTIPRDRAAFDALWAKILEDSTGIVRTIVADGEVAGSAFCFLHDGKREVGYRIGQQHWGRGIATAALAQLVAQVPERPLYATVAEHNRASLKVLEKSSFHRIGVERAGEVTMHVLRLD